MDLLLLVVEEEVLVLLLPLVLHREEGTTRLPARSGVDLNSLGYSLVWGCRR